ncbi:GntR family transcriptional regulator [Luteimicrobium subarcticum]|uniref:GntR family transcriptional regulator n=1 Tax=Luteimicrobium subarcticum TaxID=620910 RepID=A0A2M8WRR8_9MICO|nr:GntR family transcriptional regulator [Luteimicrobium subarcticum]PJI93536.1 GntR family transcriptional regulator [Luteimicrobium subarcticum]
MTTTTTAPATAPARSLSRQIYDTVRERIILGHYPEGSRLPEQRIGDELEVSRVPLREAVPLLERDGFVQTFPRRGAMVTTWDTKAIDDLFDVRLCLEVGAAGHAARQIALGGSMAPLDEALAASRRVVQERDAYAIAQASTAYHETIVKTAANDLMLKMMRTISGRMTWLFYRTSGLPVDDALDEHVSLRDAIASGNERVAEAVAYAHIERDREPSFAALAQGGPGTPGD